MLNWYKKILDHKNGNLFKRILEFDNLYQDVPFALYENECVETIKCMLALLVEYGLSGTAFNKKYPARSLMVMSVSGQYESQVIELPFDGETANFASCKKPKVDPEDKVVPLLTILCRHNLEAEYIEPLLQIGYPHTEEFLLFKLPQGVQFKPTPQFFNKTRFGTKPSEVPRKLKNWFLQVLARTRNFLQKVLFKQEFAKSLARNFWQFDTISCKVLSKSFFFFHRSQMTWSFVT